MAILKTCASVTVCKSGASIEIEKDSIDTDCNTAMSLKLPVTPTRALGSPQLVKDSNTDDKTSRIRSHELIETCDKERNSVNSVVCKRRRLSLSNSSAGASDQAVNSGRTSSTKSTPYIPEPLLGSLVAPFLDDRETFNNFKLSSRDVYRSCRNIPAPWPRKQVQCDGVVQAVTFSPSGELLAFSSESKLTLLDRQTGNRRILQAPSKITSLTFAPGGRYLASGQQPIENQPLHDRNIAVCLWDLQDLFQDNSNTSGASDRSWCQALYRYGGAHSVAFSHNGELLACGGMDMTVNLWRRVTHQVQAKKQRKEHQRFCFERSLSGMENWIYQVKFSPDGKYLAAVGEGEQAFWLWNLQNNYTATVMNDLEDCHKETVHCIDFTANGKYLVSGSDDETIRVWDLSPRVKRNDGDDQVSSLYPPPPRCCKILTGNQCSVWALACAPASNDHLKKTDETLIVSGAKDDKDSRVLRMWSLETGQTVRILKGHAAYITSIAFSPSGNTVASGSFDQRVMTHRVRKPN